MLAAEKQREMTMNMRDITSEIMGKFEIPVTAYRGGELVVKSPIDGLEIGEIPMDTVETTETKIAQAHDAFLKWRQVPAPRRGELIRIFGEELRAYKNELGRLVTIECGKIYSEGLGEVQEMIDICDFAVGQSRQLYGLTIASERPGHKMQENWHPVGPVGVISAFNFPVAVWCWNTALAVVCGDPVIWKPSEKTPMTAMACKALFERACRRFGDDAPEALMQTVIGHADLGAVLTKDKRLPLISATGSTRMGRAVAPIVAERFGRCILELGGNNAMIVTPSADLKLALPATVFGAVGTAGQRCTTQRRSIIHKDIIVDFVGSAKKAYSGIRIGNPLDENTLMGPLIDQEAFDNMQAALDRAREHECRVTGGERYIVDGMEDGFYVTPAIVELDTHMDFIKEETFAPIMYVMPYENIDDAIAMQNDVPQGLSSAIFTNDVREAEQFTSNWGSDCGIANVNIGTSGAEIGGAFGGEKETGGGRESGSDSWKAYMRRSTNTVNFSRDLPLAQGVTFDLD